MTKTHAYASILSVSAAFGLLAYALSRRGGQPPRAPAADLPTAEPAAEPQGRLVVLRAANDLGPPEPTVQCMVRAPLPISADDAEALDPDIVAEDWLARATQSERSLSEADLTIDLENIPLVIDETEPEEADFAEI